MNMTELHPPEHEDVQQEDGATRRPADDEDDDDDGSTTNPWQEPNTINAMTPTSFMAAESNQGAENARPAVPHVLS